MVEIYADREDVERHVARLIQFVRAGGGFVHDQLKIRAAGGGLSIEAPAAVAEGKRLIDVTSEQLLAVDKFDLSLSGDEICIGTPSPEVTDAQLQLMEEMLAIYNLSGKIKAHRAHAPAALFAEAPEVFRNLALPNQVRVREKDASKNLFLNDFLHTRVFAAKTGDGDKSESVLMPVIDFLNHHYTAGGFRFEDGRLYVNRHSPLPGSDECFVAYSRMDAQIALIGYGFLDRHVDFLISVPMTIELPGVGILQVGRNTGRPKKSVPPVLKGLKSVVPQFAIQPAERRARVSYLIVPSNRLPRAMRRILSFAIGPLAKEAGVGQLKPVVLEAERQVIEANRNYYKGLKSYAAGVSVSEPLRPVVEQAVAMAEHQLSLLDAYGFRMADLGDGGRAPGG